MTSKKLAEMSLSEEQIAIQQDYDEYPYDSFPYPLSHPDLLFVLSSLFGMQAVNPKSCRVLELGCASGGNLIPMAVQLPKSQFFGIDLSGKQVKRANRIVSKLGLTNIKIEHRNILSLDGNIRKFDFIICHGVYSWVPDNVQRMILKVSKQYLNENGVAYISYNTYPGWHMRESVRDMMRFHAANFENSQDKINQSRALLKFMVDSANTENDPYGQYLKTELDVLSRTSDAYLAHEHLGRNHKPVYFHEFCRDAGREGLQYLAEAELHTMLASNFPPEVAGALNKVGPNIVQQEQYMDFLRNRAFRSTLLCHKEVRLDRNIKAERLKNMHVTAIPMRILKNQDGAEPGAEGYLSQAGMRVNIGGGLTEAAYSLLGKQWPASISFAELCSKSVKLAKLPDADYEDTLAADLLKLYTAKAVELRSLPFAFALAVSDKPMVSSLARLQAAEGCSITNMRHENANVNEPTRQLILMLDGKSDQSAIAGRMLKKMGKGELVLRDGEAEITDKDKQSRYIKKFLQNILQELGKRALLVN